MYAGRDERYSLVTTVQPAEEPITLAEAKLHLRVDHSADDSYIAGLVRAARVLAEKQTGRAFVTQTLRLTMDRFPCGSEICLPRPPLIAITSVQYYDVSNVLQTVPALQYEADADADPGRVRPGVLYSWPATYVRLGAVRITYTAGYGGAALVPEPIKQAIKFFVGHWYENREAVSAGGMSAVPMATEALLASQWSGNYG